MDMNEATSKAIAAERSAAHLTIKELAKKANLNERTLIRLLQNERNINVIQLAQLAEVFGVYPHELIEAAERFIERAERGPVSLSVEPDSDDATARDYYAMAAKPNRSASVAWRRRSVFWRIIRWSLRPTPTRTRRSTSNTGTGMTQHETIAVEPERHLWPCAHGHL